MKAIITDLDRTLLHTDKSLSDYTVDVLRRCHEKGYLVIAASARPERGILPDYHKRIGFDAISALNGARILLPHQTLEFSITRSDGQAMLEKLVGYPDVLIAVEMSDGNLYANRDIPGWNPPIFDGFPALPCEGDLYKILVSSSDRSLYDDITSVLTENTHHIFAHGDRIQILHKAVSKWNSVKIMLSSLGIALEDAVFFGDDYDDIEPIRYCGIGVAVSNAIHHVRHAADYITDSNDDDGVAKFIENYILHT